MEFYIRCKVGNETEFEKYINSKFKEIENFDSFYNVQIETLKELYDFIKPVPGIINCKYVTPIIVPIDEDIFELRFED